MLLRTETSPLHLARHLRDTTGALDQVFTGLKDISIRTLANYSDLLSQHYWRHEISAGIDFYMQSSAEWWVS